MSFSSISKKSREEVDDDLFPALGKTKDSDRTSNLVFSSSDESTDEDLRRRKKEELGRKKKRKKKKKKEGRSSPRRRRYRKKGVSPDMQSLMIDIGSCLVKCGFAGDDAPRAVFPTIVGYPKNSEVMVGMEKNDYFVGDEAQAKRGFLKISSPIERGNVRQLRDELRICPEEHPVTITEPTLTRKRDREIMTHHLFGYYNVPAIFIASQSVLSLYGFGKTTGLVLSSGHGFSTSVPIFEGSPILHAVTRNIVSGKEITDHFIDILSKERHLEMKANNEREIVRDMKERMCYISADSKHEINNFTNGRTYKLPDGTKMKLGTEQFRVPEILFDPSLYSGCRRGELGIHQLIDKSIRSLEDDDDLKKKMYGTIVLSGGSTCFEGMGSRLEKEVKKSLDKNERFRFIDHVNVHSPPDRKFSVWTGGSILSSMVMFQHRWVTKDEFDDHGMTIIHRKCFDWTPLLDEGPILHMENVEDRKDRIGYIRDRYWKNEDISSSCCYVVKHKSSEMIQEILILPRFLI